MSIIDEQIQWFQDARFGLFLHWGLYSVLAGEWQGQRMDYIGEWIMSRFRIPRAEYEKLAARFNPQAFDADQWVSLAKRAGMRYMVFTAKHHEGFAMYHSACDPYNIVDATPFGRDPLQELAQACQQHGLGLGLYYSQDLDWHEPHGGDPGPDFPKNFGMSWGNDWDFPKYTAKYYSLYFERKVKPQVRELLTNYGPVSLLWFDCPVSLSREQSLELFNLVRELQPGCLVNSRLGHNLGDYGSLGDNQVPTGQAGGIWETPATLNDTWGYKSFDHNWKSAPETLGVLAGLASKNVNYLLNIGPQPDGRFPQASVEVLSEIGDWMDTYGEAIHATRQSPFPYDLEWGWITQHPGDGEHPARLYLFFKDWPQESFTLRGLRSRVRLARELATPEKNLPIEQIRNPDHDLDELHLRLPAGKPASHIPVVALDLAGDLNVDPRLMAQPGAGQSEMIALPAASGRVLPPPGENAETIRFPALESTGILTNWLDSRVTISWIVHIPEPGNYRVEMITSAIHHSQPWQGGHQVRLETEQDWVETILELDEPDTRPETRCYAQASSGCGTLHFSSSGMHRVTLKPLHIQPNGGVGLALVEVRLRRGKV